MSHNLDEVVMSADCQFNGAVDFFGNEINHVRNFDEYVEAVPGFMRKYPVVVNLNLPYLGAEAHFQSQTESSALNLRLVDEQLLGSPVEFYQSFLQKNQHDVDYKGSHSEFMDHVKYNTDFVNEMYDVAFSVWHAGGSFDQVIYEAVDQRFSGIADHEMLGILKGYFTQKPVRSVFMMDIESSPASFHWQEPTYQVLKKFFCDIGMDHMVSVSGKGYHFLSQVPLEKDGYLNDVMMMLAAIGGEVKDETIKRLCNMELGSRKQEPVSIFAQRAYQGMWKLMQFVLVNNADEIRFKMAEQGMDPYVAYTENSPEAVILDSTCNLRQVSQGDFGSLGSRYGKTLLDFIVRIPRSRFEHGFNEEYFDTIEEMDFVRRNWDSARAHLINHSCRIPDGSHGMSNLIEMYDNSVIKHFLHDPCSKPLDEGLINGIIHTNYGRDAELVIGGNREDLRAVSDNVANIIDSPQPCSINPYFLDEFNNDLGWLHPCDRMHVLAAVYKDKKKQIHLPFNKVSYEEHINWIILLSGEDYKGFL